MVEKNKRAGWQADAPRESCQNTEKRNLSLILGDTSRPATGLHFGPLYRRGPHLWALGISGELVEFTTRQLMAGPRSKSPCGVTVYCLNRGLGLLPACMSNDEWRQIIDGLSKAMRERDR